MLTSIGKFSKSFFDLILLNSPEIFQIGITYSQMSIRVVLRVFRNLSRFNFTLYLKNPLFTCLIAFQFGFGVLFSL